MVFVIIVSYFMPRLGGARLGLRQLILDLVCMHLQVLVNGLYTTENTHTLELDRPVMSVALDPMYFKSGSGRRFVTGDDRLILHEKVFLSRLKSTTLFEGEGSITNIKWRGRFLTWASSSGVRIMDLSIRRIISIVKKDISPGFISSLVSFPP